MKLREASRGDRVKFEAVVREVNAGEVWVEVAGTRTQVALPSDLDVPVERLPAADYE